MLRTSLGAGVLAAVLAVSSAVAQPPPAPTAPPVLPAPTPVPSASAAEAGAGPPTFAAAVGGRLRGPGVGRSVGAAILDLSSGELVWRQGSRAAYTPASTTKLLTATAVLATLPPDHRFTTRVLRGSRPGRLVLVGGGDPLLSATTGRLPYGVPRTPIAQLAGRTAAALAAQPVRLGARRSPIVVDVDDSLFARPAAPASWEPGYVPAGIAGKVGALALDGGRAEPGPRRRVADPALAAGQELARRLTAAGVPARLGRRVTAPPQAAELAAVTSAPLARVVEHTLEYSDNDMAEVLARHVAVARGGIADAAGAAAAIRRTLTELGVDLRGSTVLDGSGLSRGAAVEPRDLVATLALTANPARPELGAVLSGLPVAGLTGSLADRFDEPAERAGAGLVRAKTGSLTGISALAGTVVAADGHTYAFAFLLDAVPGSPLPARDALDEAAAALARCGCRTGP